MPIINENDTISVDEIKFGDNDRLAAMVTNLLQAPLLVILSVVDGLYRADPTPSTDPEIVRLVPQIDDQVLSLAGTGRSSLGTGGMQSKLAAARLVTQAGGSVIIASGTKPEPLTRILAGEPVGTLFLAHGTSHRARKRWIGLTARPRGHYTVDAGARRRWNRARRAYSPLASSKSLANSRKATSSGFATRPVKSSLVDSRTTPRRMPSASAAFVPTRPVKHSAQPSTTKSFTAITSCSSSERTGDPRLIYARESAPVTA